MFNVVSVVCLLSRFRLTSARSLVLAPVVCRVLGSGFGSSSGRKGDVPTFSWPCELSV